MSRARGWNRKPSRWFVCFVTALVGLGVEEHSKLARKLRILPTAMPQHFIAMGGVSCVLYYLEILNESEGKTVDNVNVSLVRVAPAIESLSWLPVSLHIKHDNAKPHRTSFSLNPNEHKQIDLVSAPESADRIWRQRQRRGPGPPSWRLHIDRESDREGRTAKRGSFPCLGG